MTNHITFPFIDAAAAARALTGRARPAGRAGACAVAAGLLLAIAACGSDADAGGEADLATRYCAAVADVNQHAEQIFTAAAETAGTEDLTIEQVFAAEREVFGYLADQGYDTMEVPEEIADAWRTFIDGMNRKLAAATPQQPGAEVDAADERIVAWEAEHCPG